MALKLLLEEKHLWFICCCLRWRLFCCVWITLFYYYLSWILVHEKHVFHWVLYLQLLLNMIRQLWSGNCLIHRKFLRRMFDPRMKNGLSLLIQLSVQVFTLLLLRWFCLFMFFVIKCRVLFVFFVKHHLLQGHLRWRNHQRCRTIFFSRHISDATNLHKRESYRRSPTSEETWRSKLYKSWQRNAYFIIQESCFKADDNSCEL